jgi:hypothetical protein
MMPAGYRKSRLKASEFRFAPVRSWLGSEVVERTDGWRTRVYEGTGERAKAPHVKLGIGNRCGAATSAQMHEATVWPHRTLLKRGSY